MIDKEKLEYIRKEYPKGTRIRLVYMEDAQAVPSGTLGTVDFVDDAGQIQMEWDNGSTLALIYGVDVFVKQKIKEKDIER